MEKIIKLIKLKPRNLFAKSVQNCQDVSSRKTIQKIYKTKSDFGRLNLITESFQQCYLNKRKSVQYFKSLLENEEKEYSRYLFFYFLNLIENEDFKTTKEISSKIDTLNSNLIVFQSKKWIDGGEFSNFKKFFSCENPEYPIS